MIMKSTMIGMTMVVFTTLVMETTVMNTMTTENDADDRYSGGYSDRYIEFKLIEWSLSNAS